MPVTSSYEIVINTPPLFGDITINPPTGDPLKTLFKITAVGY